MKQSFLLAGLLALLLFPSTAGAAGPNERQVVMALTEVATGTPVSVSVLNQNHTKGYLVVTTANETATASLVVTVFNEHELDDTLVCSLTAITTNSTWVTLFDSSLTAAAGVDQVCIWPMGRLVKLTFTTTGTNADFDVTADIEWVVR
jgi:hypothetical protein